MANCECNQGMGRIVGDKQMMIDNVFGIEPAPGDRVISLPSSLPVADEIPEPVVDPAITGQATETNWLPILIGVGVIGYFLVKGK